MTESKISSIDASNMSLDECVNALGIKCEQRNKKRGGRKNDHIIEPMDESNFDASVPDASSQQWRLLDPNRPVGMAPLVPSNARQHFYRHNKRRNFNNSYADRDLPFNGLNRRSHGIFKNNSRPNANTNALCTALVPAQNNAVMTMNQLSQGLAGMVAPLISNGSTYENLFSKIMEKWEGQQSRKQKYDMGVQKEISQMQGKTLYFSCSSGGPQTVVSSDGHGVECEVKVATTNTSMHQRFA